MGLKTLSLSPHPRPRLIERIAPPGSLLTYIHADEGYGKTTLLMQYAGGRSGAAWLSLDERDANAAYFLHHLEDAIREKLSRFDFHTTDLLPFANGGVFIPTAVSALLKALCCRKLTFILDDVHLLADSASADLLSRLARDCPPNLTLVMAGRHQLWDGLFRLKADVKIAEITKADLRFNREEAEKLWGFFNEDAYSAIEGWALALHSYRMALADNRKLSLPQDDSSLHRYLLEEIFKQLTEEMRHFLLATAWLPELEAEV